MKTLLITLFASLFLTACGAPASNNTNAGPTNKPANSAASGANTAKPVADTAAVEADIKKFLADFEAALNKNEADPIAKFYDDTYTLIDQNGAMQTKASRIEQVSSGKLKWEGLKFSDVKVRVHPAGDAATLYAKANGKTLVEGKPEERNSLVTWVATKRGDGWKFVHAQITDIKASAPKTEANKPANTAPASNKPANK